MAVYEKSTLPSADSLHQADYLKVVGWGRFNLSMIMLQGVLDEEGRGCHGQPGIGYHRIWMPPGMSCTQTASAERQRFDPSLWRDDSRHEARARRALPSATSGARSKVTLKTEPPLATPKRSRLNPEPDERETSLNHSFTCLKSSDDRHLALPRHQKAGEARLTYHLVNVLRSFRLAREND